jgi:hypothetical protein
MKRLLIIIYFIINQVQLNAQSSLALEDLKHYRIHLDNRTNRHLKEVPKQLLDGYCKGIYKAYYPKATFNEVNFGDFLDHFLWNEPLLNESVFCGEDYCSNPSFTEFFSKFNFYLDYYEHNTINTTNSVMVRKVEFVQLVYNIEVYGKTYIFRGPLFRMDEIEKTILVKNPANNSEPQSIKYVFELGRFYSTQITDSELKTKEKRLNKQEDMQNH